MPSLFRIYFFVSAENVNLAGGVTPVFVDSDVLTFNR